MINKIGEGFKKIVALTKSKELKRYAKNTTKLQRIKKQQSKI